MANIDTIIADIDKALDEQEDVDTYDWVLKAKELSETLTRKEINELCQEFNGVPLNIPVMCNVRCECKPQYVRLLAKEIDEGYGWGIFVDCLQCKQESVHSIPFEMLGRGRVVASLAVCMRETSDGY